MEMLILKKEIALCKINVIVTVMRYTFCINNLYKLKENVAIHILRTDGL